MEVGLILIQFPITALREIKLLKLLSHPNVLKLEEMAVEHSQKGSTLLARTTVTLKSYLLVE
jgi:hypothetical protein